MSSCVTKHRQKNHADETSASLGEENNGFYFLIWNTVLKDKQKWIYGC